MPDKANSLIDDQPDDRGHVPPQRWTIERPFDSSAYLEGAPPRYESPVPRAREGTPRSETGETASLDDPGLEAKLPTLQDHEFPHFAQTKDQRRRWRLVVGLTRLIAGGDDFAFASELYFGDLPTDVPPESGTTSDASGP